MSQKKTCEIAQKRLVFYSDFDRAMDSIEESATAGQTILFASVSCVVAMLSALQELCEGKAISHSYTCTINTLYEDLEACDYRGPLTYQSMARLPKTYR